MGSLEPRVLLVFFTIALVSPHAAPQMDPAAVQQRAIGRVDAFIDLYRRTGTAPDGERVGGPRHGPAVEPEFGDRRQARMSTAEVGRRRLGDHHVHPVRGDGRETRAAVGAERHSPPAGRREKVQAGGRGRRRQARR